MRACIRDLFLEYLTVGALAAVYVPLTQAPRPPPSAPRAPPGHTMAPRVRAASAHKRAVSQCGKKAGTLPDSSAAPIGPRLPALGDFLRQPAGLADATVMIFWVRSMGESVQPLASRRYAIHT